MIRNLYLALLISCQLTISIICHASCEDYAFTQPEKGGTTLTLTSLFTDQSTGQIIAIINGQQYIVGKDTIGNGQITPGITTDTVQIKYKNKATVILSLYD